MTTKRIVRISYFTMLTVIGAFISIPLPGAPIKLTFQTLFVIMSGIILGGRDGAIAQIAYMILGLIGLPVFSAGGGFDYVLRPSFGYILGFPLGAFVAGGLISRQKTLSVWKLFLCAFAGVVASYIIGVTYQVLILTLYSGNSFVSVLAGLVTIPLLLVKDSVLVFIVCLLYPRVKSMIGKAGEKAKSADPEQDSQKTEEASGEPSEPEEGDSDSDKGRDKPIDPVPEPAGMSQ